MHVEARFRSNEYFHHSLTVAARGGLVFALLGRPPVFPACKANSISLACNPRSRGYSHLQRSGRDADGTFDLRSTDTRAACPFRRAKRDFLLTVVSTRLCALPSPFVHGTFTYKYF
jgi:hypothetical protein